MEFSLLKAQSESSSQNPPLTMDLLKKTHSIPVEGEYINFIEDFNDDDEDEEQELNTDQYPHHHHHRHRPRHLHHPHHDDVQFKTISQDFLKEHILRVSEIYKQMVVHVQNCPKSLCNFIHLCQNLQQYTSKVLDMDLPQIGYFEINTSPQSHTFNKLCDKGRELNIKMKEEFLDFIQL